MDLTVASSCLPTRFRSRLTGPIFFKSTWQVWGIILLCIWCEAWYLYPNMAFQMPRTRMHWWPCWTSMMLPMGVHLAAKAGAEVKAWDLWLPLILLFTYKSINEGLREWFLGSIWFCIDLQSYRDGPFNEDEWYDEPLQGSFGDFDWEVSFLFVYVLDCIIVTELFYACERTSLIGCWMHQNDANAVVWHLIWLILCSQEIYNPEVDSRASWLQRKQVHIRWHLWHGIGKSTAWEYTKEFQGIWCSSELGGNRRHRSLKAWSNKAREQTWAL